MKNNQCLKIIYILRILIISSCLKSNLNNLNNSNNINKQDLVLPLTNQYLIPTVPSTPLPSTFMLTTPTPFSTDILSLAKFPQQCKNIPCVLVEGYLNMMKSSKILDKESIPVKVSINLNYFTVFVDENVEILRISMNEIEAVQKSKTDSSCFKIFDSLSNVYKFCSNFDFNSTPDDWIRDIMKFKIECGASGAFDEINPNQTNSNSYHNHHSKRRKNESKKCLKKMEEFTINIINKMSDFQNNTKSQIENVKKIVIENTKTQQGNNTLPNDCKPGNYTFPQTLQPHKPVEPILPIKPAQSSHTEEGCQNNANETDDNQFETRIKKLIKKQNAESKRLMNALNKLSQCGQNDCSKNFYNNGDNNSNTGNQNIKPSNPANIPNRDNTNSTNTNTNKASNTENDMANRLRLEKLLIDEIEQKYKNNPDSNNKNNIYPTATTSKSNQNLNTQENSKPDTYNQGSKNINNSGRIKNDDGSNNLRSIQSKQKIVETPDTTAEKTSIITKTSKNSIKFPQQNNIEHEDDVNDQKSSAHLDKENSDIVTKTTRKIKRVLRKNENEGKNSKDNMQEDSSQNNSNNSENHNNEVNDHQNNYSNNGVNDKPDSQENHHEQDKFKRTPENLNSNSVYKDEENSSDKISNDEKKNRDNSKNDSITDPNNENESATTKTYTKSVRRIKNGGQEEENNEIKEQRPNYTNTHDSRNNNDLNDNKDHPQTNTFVSKKQQICFTKDSNEMMNYWQNNLKKASLKRYVLSSSTFCYLCCKNELNENSLSVKCCQERCDVQKNKLLHVSVSCIDHHAEMNKQGYEIPKHGYKSPREFKTVLTTPFYPIPTVNW